MWFSFLPVFASDRPSHRGRGRRKIHVKANGTQSYGLPEFVRMLCKFRIQLVHLYNEVFHLQYSYSEWVSPFILANIRYGHISTIYLDSSIILTLELSRISTWGRWLSISSIDLCITILQKLFLTSRSGNVPGSEQCSGLRSNLTRGRRSPGRHACPSTSILETSRFNLLRLRLVLLLLSPSLLLTITLGPLSSF